MGKGRAPCCEKVGLNKGSWSAEEDMRLMAFIHKYGHGNWRSLPKLAGLLRCGKSCRLRWINYLRPDIRRGNFTKEEEDTIIRLHTLLGNKWSKIASCLPGRTDNEIKNVWNTHLKKRLASKVGKSHGDATTSSSSSSSGCTSHQHSSSDQSERAKISSYSIETIEIPSEPAGVDMWSMLLDDDVPLSNTPGPEPKEVDDASTAPRPAAHAYANSSTTSSSICGSPSSSSSQASAINRDERKPQEQDVSEADESLAMLDVDIEQEFWSMVDDGDCGATSPAGMAREFGQVSSMAVAEEAGGEGGGSGSSSDGGWLVYLEKELGLLGSSHGDHDGLLISGTDMELEGDPVSNYFQKGSLL